MIESYHDCQKLHKGEIRHCSFVNPMDIGQVTSMVSCIDRTRKRCTLVDKIRMTIVFFSNVYVQKVTKSVATKNLLNF